MGERTRRLSMAALICCILAPAWAEPDFARAQEPSLSWRYATGGRIRSSPVVAPDGTIYAASEDGLMYAWTPEGLLRWKRDLGWLPWDCIAVGLDGTVYAGLKNGDFAAVNPHGKILWRARLDGVPVGDPVVSMDGALYVGTDAGTLFALSHLGRVQWTVTLPGAITRAPVMDGAGTIYILCADRRLYSLTEWGQFKWSLPLPAAATPPSISVGGTVVFGTEGGEVIAVNAGGEIQWRRALGASLVGISCGGGQVVAAGAKGLLAGLSESGVVLWRIESGKGLDTAPMVAESRLFVISSDGVLLTVDSARGVISRFPIGTAGAAVLTRSGMLYLGGRDWIFYAIGSVMEAGADAQTPTARGAAYAGTWPQPGHDEEHTGRTDAAPPAGNEALLGSLPDFLYIQSLASGDRDILLRLLSEIRSRILSDSLGKSTWYVVRQLERLAGEGILDPVYRNMKLVNDFPEIRAEAATLLGMAGSLSSRNALIKVIGAEKASIALAAEIEALGLIGSDTDGASARAVADAAFRGETPDNLVAAATVFALDRLAAYEGAVRDPAAINALIRISRGGFSRQVRDGALSVLSHMGK